MLKQKSFFLGHPVYGWSEVNRSVHTLKFDCLKIKKNIDPSPSYIASFICKKWNHNYEMNTHTYCSVIPGNQIVPLYFSFSIFLWPNFILFWSSWQVVWFLAGRTLPCTFNHTLANIEIRCLIIFIKYFWLIEKKFPTYRLFVAIAKGSWQMIY